MQNLAYPTESEERLLALDEPSLEDDIAGRQQTAISDNAISSHYEVEDKVKRAEEQLIALQQKRERLEQQKLELEQLSAKQQKFTEGKAEVMKVLTGALPILENESSDALRRSEFLNHMNDVFSQHLTVLATLDADNWEEQHLKAELERGMAALNEAKGEIESFDQRMEGLGEEQSPLTSYAKRSSPADSDFSRLMKMGFAFALPLMIFTALTLLVIYIITAQ